MWKIGDVRIDGPVVLGPMSGVTSSSYREFMKPFGVALSVSEMTSDTGIIHGMNRTMEYILFEENYPTALQIFGHDIDVIVTAAEMALRRNPNIDIIDINMGCPVRKVIRNGSGSALMKYPEKCGEIICKLKKKVDVPVTAKIRLGWDDENLNFMDVIGELTDADVDAICVHARTKDQGYAGLPDYDKVTDLQSKMSVPLIISGNIYCLEDAKYAMEKTGAPGVMVARGGVGNPFLVTQIDRYFRTGEVLENPTISEQVDWCIQLFDKLYAEKGEHVTVRKIRSFAPRFISGCNNCREYRNRLAAETDNRDILVEILSEVKEKMGTQRTHSIGCSALSDFDELS